MDKKSRTIYEQGLHNQMQIDLKKRITAMAT